MDAQARVADPHVLTAAEGNLPEAHRASAVSTRMKVRHALAVPAARSGIAQAMEPAPSTTALAARSRIQVILRPESRLAALGRERGGGGGAAECGAGPGLVVALTMISPMAAGKLAPASNRGNAQSRG